MLITKLIMRNTTITTYMLQQHNIIWARQYTNMQLHRSILIQQIKTFIVSVKHTYKHMVKVILRLRYQVCLVQKCFSLQWSTLLTQGFSAHRWWEVRREPTGRMNTFGNGCYPVANKKTHIIVFFNISIHIINI